MPDAASILKKAALATRKNGKKSSKTKSKKAFQSESKSSKPKNMSNSKETDVDEIPVDFGFFEPYETDYHGVKPLLIKGYEWCKSKPILEVSELTNTICEQGNIGTVLKTEAESKSNSDSSDQTVIGVCTLLNLKQYSRTIPVDAPEGTKETYLSMSMPLLVKWFKEKLGDRDSRLEQDLEEVIQNIIKNGEGCKREKKMKEEAIKSNKGLKKLGFLEEYKTVNNNSNTSSKTTNNTDSDSDSDPYSLEYLLYNTNVGFLINERILGLPEEDCVPTMHNALLDGIQWSQTTPQCSEKERNFYFFDCIMGISRGEIITTSASISDSESISESLQLEYPEEQAYINASEYAKEVDVGDGRTLILWLMEASKLKEIVKEGKVKKALMGN